jgi:transforming growth factor-beta-induced protein
MTPNTLARWAIGFVVLATFAAGCTDDDEAAETTTTTIVDDADADAAAESGTIAEVAAADGRFATLVAAVDAAGLGDALNGDDELTVFAPTDDAFAALPAGTVDDLLADPDGALTDVLTYHVVAGAVPASDVVTLDGQMVETLNGQSVTISVDGDTVKVNEATVIITDVEASNGVIHVIDAVLVPTTS